MIQRTRPLTILMADDDPEDRLLAKDALVDAALATDIRFVSDGEELMDYLRGRARYGSAAAAPRPSLILLDLNMPRKDGREALEEIKADPELRNIPVVILTTSHDHEDIANSYRAGANSYITKPVTFDKLVKTMEVLGEYWFDVVELPN